MDFVSGLAGSMFPADQHGGHSACRIKTQYMYEHVLSQIKNRAGKLQIQAQDGVSRRQNLEAVSSTRPQCPVLYLQLQRSDWIPPEI